MIRNKKIGNGKIWIYGFLVLALVVCVSLVVAVSGYATTSNGQLSNDPLNANLSGSNDENLQTDHNVLSNNAEFTTTTDVQAPVQDDQNTGTNVQCNTQNPQTIVCSPSNTKCPATGNDSTSCSPSPSPIATPTSTPSPTITPVDDNTYIPTDSEGLWPYLTPAQQAECREFDKHNMFPSMIGHNRVADYVVWKKENMASDMFRDMYGLPLDGNTARYYAKMVDNKEINDAGAWTAVKNAMIKDKESMETCYYNGEPINMRNNNIF